MSTTRPNILLIFSDQHRHDAMGCAGNTDVYTPNLDWLATGGKRYKTAWCQSPFCQPSRTSFVSGLYPHQTAFQELAALSSPPTLMKKLQTAGYETANFGKMHYTEIQNLKRRAGKDEIHTAEFDDFFKQFGWDHLVQEFDKYHHVTSGVTTPYLDYLDSVGLKTSYQQQIRQHMRGTVDHWKAGISSIGKEHDLTTFLTNHAISWLDSSERDQDKPFFLKLAYVQPHPPMIADNEWSDYYADKEIELPSFERIKSDVPVWHQYVQSLENHAQISSMKKSHHIAAIKQYYAMISLIDEEVGRLNTHLEKLNLLDNTIVIYTGDHGEMMGEKRLWGKMNFYPGAVQVPLIIKSANENTNKGNVVETPVELLDLHKYILNLGRALPNTDNGTTRSLEEFNSGYTHSQYGEFFSCRKDQHQLTMHIPTNTICEALDHSRSGTPPTNIYNPKKKLDRPLKLLLEYSEEFLNKPLAL